MNTVVVVAEHQDEFTLLSANFSHLPIHFSWNKNILQAMERMAIERPFILFVVSKKLEQVVRWLQTYDASRIQIPIVAFLPGIDWADRELLWKTGVSDIVELPRGRKELEYIIRAFLIQPQVQSEKQPNDIQGHLQDLKVVDLIRSFGHGKKSAALVIENGPAKGDLEFYKGKLVNAKFAECDPLESVMVMSLWNKGIFYGNYDNEKRKERIVLDNEQIVIECLNYQKDYQKYLKSLPDWDVLLFTDPDLEYQEFGPKDREILQKFREGLTLNELMTGFEGNWNFLLKKFELWLDRKWILPEEDYHMLQAKIKAEARKSVFRKALDKVFSNPDEETVEPLTGTGEESSEENILEQPKIHSLFNQHDLLLHFKDADEGCLEVPVIVTSQSEEGLFFAGKQFTAIENKEDFAVTSFGLEENKSVLFYRIRQFNIRQWGALYSPLFAKVPFVLVLFERENRQLLSLAKQIENSYDVPLFFLTSKSVSQDVDEMVEQDMQALDGKKVLLYDSLDAQHLKDTVYQAIDAFAGMRSQK